MNLFRKLTLPWRLFQDRIEKYAARSGHTKESGFVPFLLLGAAVAGYLGYEFFKTRACSPTDIECIGISVAGWLIKLSFGTIAAAAEYIFKGVAAVMGWTLANFLSIPVSPGADGIVPIVTAGWDLSRMLVNSIFLLVFVFIGLATILRLQNYQLQRTLPTLIVVVLLVNFSGVFVGFVVDIANLITNFFLQAVRNIQWDIPWPGKAQPTGTDLAEIAALSIGKILYYLVAIFIFVGITAIFFVRIFMLWILTILAPLAFAAYVLPNTRGWWNRWLGSLLQWAFVGVPMSFFLYLSGLALSMSATDIVSQSSANEAGAFAGFLAPFTALFLLLVGMVVSVAMGPGVVQRAVRTGQKIATIGAGTALGVTGAYAARDWFRKKVAESGTLRRMEMMSAGEGRLGRTLGRVPGVAAGARAFARNTRARAVRSQARDAAKAQAAVREEPIEALVSKLRGRISDSERVGIWNEIRNRRQFRHAVDPAIVGEGVSNREILAGRKAALAAGNEDLVEAMDRAYGAREVKDSAGNQVDYTDREGNRQEITRPIYEDYTDAEGNPAKRIKKDLHGNEFREIVRDEAGNVQYRKKVLADDFAAQDDIATAKATDPEDRTQGGFTQRDVDRGILTQEEFENRTGSYLKKIIADATGADEIRQLPRRFWRSPDAIDAVHNFWTGNQIQQAAINFGRDFMNAIENSKAELLEQNPNYYFEPVARGRRRDPASGNMYTVYQPRNPAVARQFASTPGQALGFSPVPGAETTDALRDLTNAAREEARRLTEEARTRATAGPAPGGAPPPSGNAYGPPPGPETPPPSPPPGGTPPPSSGSAYGP